jgi:hypothetical protein
MVLRFKAVRNVKGTLPLRFSVPQDLLQAAKNQSHKGLIVLIPVLLPENRCQLERESL